MLADWNEIDRLQRENATLRAALESMISLAVSRHECAEVLNGHCTSCTGITQAREALTGARL